MTTTTHPLSDRAVSWLRTTVPVLWGTVVAAILRTATPHLPGDLGTALADWLGSETTLALVTAAAIAAWYALWRWVEPRIPDWLTRLVLGSAQTPVYVRDAEIGVLEEYSPPTSGTPPPLERGDHVTIAATGQGGKVFYADQREDGWHYGVQLDGTDQVRMYRPDDLA
jgi:hypothetical protein